MPKKCKHFNTFVYGWYGKKRSANLNQLGRFEPPFGTYPRQI